MKDLVGRWYRGRLAQPPVSHLPSLEFEGEDYFLFRRCLGDSKRYLEFGSGASTCFVSKKFDVQIRSVETDKGWADKVIEECGNRAEVIYVDVGPVGDWGTPLTYEKRGAFSEYLYVGFRNYSPDVVYVDGRFRVAAFLSTLLLTKPGTRVIFDDYPYRPLYHVVEEILSPVETSPRQALFIRPTGLDTVAARKLMHSFENVFE